MAEDSWPKSTRNGGTITDYEHEQLVAPTQHSGLIGQPTDPTLVYADSTGLQIKVRANRYGMVRAKEWFSGPVEYTKAIAANSSGAIRYDLVVLRWDRATNAVTQEVRQGTPGQARPAPVQQTPPTTGWGTGIWELPIAEVKVISGAATIAAGDVTYLAWYIGPDGLILCTDTTRPYGAVPYPGMEIYESNTGNKLRWTGAWQITDRSNAWVDFSSAALVSAVGGYAKGSSTYSARYTQEDKRVTYAFKITINTAGGFAPGAGPWLILLPVAAHASLLGNGALYVLDNGTRVCEGTLVITDATHLSMALNTVVGNFIDSNGPGTAWATGDVIQGSIVYEAA